MTYKKPSDYLSQWLLNLKSAICLQFKLLLVYCEERSPFPKLLLWKEKQRTSHLKHFPTEHFALKQSRKPRNDRKYVVQKRRYTFTETPYMRKIQSRSAEEEKTEEKTRFSTLHLRRDNYIFSLLISGESGVCYKIDCPDILL